MTKASVIATKNAPVILRLISSELFNSTAIFDNEMIKKKHGSDT